MGILLAWYSDGNWVVEDKRALLRSLVMVMGLNVSAGVGLVIVVVEVTQERGWSDLALL